MAVLLLSAEAMRELDRVTIEEIGILGPVLMETAARSCAETVEEMLPSGREGKIAVLCGKGNNGGDGMAAARTLHNWGYRVDAMLLADPKALHGDALTNQKILDRIGVDLKVVTKPDELSDLNLQNYDVIIDALLGTGLSKEVKGFYADAIRAINASETPVLSVDIPSGLSADTGAVLGSAVKATRTVTFAYPKLGQVLYPGSNLCGELTVADIGIPPHLAPKGSGLAWLLEEKDLLKLINTRDSGSHKGHFGHLVVVAGSETKPGAAGLCCYAAMRSGAGLVTLAASKQVVDRVVFGPVEYMGAWVESYEDLAEFCSNKQALAIGPGLGVSPQVKELVGKCIADMPIPMVVDADGLNNLAGELDLLKSAKSARILTPHPGEMARLLETSTVEIQKDRLGMARKLSSEYGCITVLKGSRTVIADADKTAYIVPAGNPGMASGGTGDVLTGIIGSLLAQGLEALDAALAGTYLHSLAGDYAVYEKGQHSLVASDLIETIPKIMKRYETW